MEETEKNLLSHFAGWRPNLCPLVVQQVSTALIQRSLGETKLSLPEKNLLLMHGVLNHLCSLLDGALETDDSIRNNVENLFMTLCQSQADTRQSLQTLKKDSKTEEERRVFLSLSAEMIEREGVEDACLLIASSERSYEWSSFVECIHSARQTLPHLDVIILSK